MTIEQRTPTTNAAEETWRVIDDVVTFKVTTDQTHQTFALFATQTPPGAGTPPHRHPGEDEAFYVLEGNYTFVVNDAPRVLHAHQAVYVPAGAVHAYTNTGATQGRMLIINTPGLAHERFFRLAGVPVSAAPTNPPNIARIVAIADECGIEILPLQSPS